MDVVDPLTYEGWDDLVARHPDATIFHTTAWARVLQDCYGHKPAYFCRFNNGSLVQCLPVMEVSSALTGRRGVSLPFADYCPALTTEKSGVKGSYAEAIRHGETRGWRSLEARGGTEFWPGASSSIAFYGHVLDLTPGAALLCRQFDPAARRAIRKAEHSGLRVEFSQTPAALRVYYDLHCQTRRRQGVPPQPKRFFESIARHILVPGHGFVATASIAGKAAAGAVFFRFGHQAIYKFAASDSRFQALRPNNLVMTKAIERLAGAGAKLLHLGRTSLGNEGLRRFKLGFATQEQRIEYCRYDLRRQAFVTATDRSQSWANHLFRLMPAPLIRLAGRMLYPHLA